MLGRSTRIEGQSLAGLVVWDGDLQGHEKIPSIKEQSSGQMPNIEQGKNLILELGLLIGTRLQEQATGEAHPSELGCWQDRARCESQGSTHSAV